MQEAKKPISQILLMFAVRSSWDKRGDIQGSAWDFCREASSEISV